MAMADRQHLGSIGSNVWKQRFHFGFSINSPHIGTVVRVTQKLKWRTDFAQARAWALNSAQTALAA